MPARRNCLKKAILAFAVLTLQHVLRPNLAFGAKCRRHVLGAGHRILNLSPRHLHRGQRQQLQRAERRSSALPGIHSADAAPVAVAPDFPEVCRLQCPEVLEALRRAQLPRNRRSAARDLKPGCRDRDRGGPEKVQHRQKSRDDLGCRGCTLGLTTDYGKNVAISSAATRVRPELTRVLCAACRAADPEFRFTSIQVNLNTRYAMHTDGYDAGASRMLSCGNFTLGRMWLHNWAAGNWSLVDTHDQWIAFDGREFHLTEEWDGPERYSLVFFTNSGWCGQNLQPGVRQTLEALGFPWPQQSDTFQRLLPMPPERRADAEKTMPPDLAKAELPSELLAELPEL
mmetsp:Transcript_74018/g.133432  ORF Transcript_74018/g.133432 Transcript_74018/m.133432 type:complete len:342 (+) Transcript_74018:201-1226(+)